MPRHKTAFVDDLIKEKANPKPKPMGRPKKPKSVATIRREFKAEKGYFPRDRPSSARKFAEAMLDVKAEDVMSEIIRKGLDPTDPHQGLMLKLMLERIMPPVREVNVKQDKQTAISIIVEGVKNYEKDVIDAQVIPDMLEDAEMPSRGLKTRPRGIDVVDAAINEEIYRSDYDEDDGEDDYEQK